MQSEPATSSPVIEPVASGTSSADEAEAIHTLADDLKRLQSTANGMPITVQTLLDTLADRGHAVVILLLTAPFVVLPIPGLSTIVGLVVMGVSLGVLFNSKALVPGFIRRRSIQPETLTRLVNGTTKTLGRLKRFVRPRMGWLTGPSWHWLIGISLITANVAFALPGPPGNNIPPALIMVLLALGLLERDGLLVLIGHILNLLLWIAIAVLVILFWEVVGSYVQTALQKFSALFK
jgi:hypothetical protein